MQRLERSFSSLAVCYVFLASLATLLLVYVRVELQANPPDLSNLAGGLMHGSISIHAINSAQVLAGARSALITLRERMHTTWLFVGVFAAVWLACLFWMQIERHRRGLRFSQRDLFWVAAFTMFVFAIAVLYGMGTNGVLAEHFPGIIPVSDVVALGVVLALPLIAWSRLGKLQEEQEDAEFYGEDSAPARTPGFLGLNDDETNARLVEQMSRLEVRPVGLHPAVQAFHADTPNEHAGPTPVRQSDAVETPIAVQRIESVPSATNAIPEPSALPVSDVAAKPVGKDIESFRHHLAAINQSWQRIEALRLEIDEWFERRRREAIAHLDMHPGMRSSVLEKSLLQNFPNEKLAEVDAEWAEIRNASVEIQRWFSEVPAPDQSLPQSQSK